MSQAREQEGILRIDVLDLLVAVDVYGEQRQAMPIDSSPWTPTPPFEVLFEDSLGSADFTGYLGEWNLAFLKWLKSVSITAQEEIGISYEFERGDCLYQVAWWHSSPLAPEGETEVFGLQHYDGMDSPEWWREAVRRSDGQIEVRGEGEPSEP